MNKLGAAALLLFAVGCTSTNHNNNGNECDSAAGSSVSTGAGGDGGEGGAPSGTPASFSIGFGAYAPACGSPNVFAHQGEDGVNLGHVATTVVTLPFSGTVVRATAVHIIEGGQCDSSQRDILVSEAFKSESPSSSGLHERLTFDVSEVVSAPVYGMPGVSVGRARSLGRYLAEPFHVKKGERVAVGTVMSPTGVCATGCDKRLDGNDPPGGSTDCADGQAWGDCVVPGFYLAYAAWIDVVPD